MKKRLIKWLLSLAKYLGWVDDKYKVPPQVYEMAKKMYIHVTDVDQVKRSGEWKRHQVYAKGLKRWPYEAKDNVALAIEIAVRRMKGK